MTIEEIDRVSKYRCEVAGLLGGITAHIDMSFRGHETHQKGMEYIRELVREFDEKTKGLKAF